MTQKTQRLDWEKWGGLLVLLVFWQVLLWAQNPSLMSDDSGEMIAASYRLGIAHPPGYPLFCLLGRLFSFLPLGTVAFRFNLFSALCVVVSFGFIGLACLSFFEMSHKNGSSRAIGLMATFLALIFLFSCRSIFAQALSAKGCVYTLTLLFLSLFLWWRVKSYEQGLTLARVFLICFLWTLGLSNHWESEILWIPFLAYWLYQEKITWDIKRFLQVSSIGIIGLSLYLYLPLRAARGGLPSWGDPKSLQGLIWVVSRKPYRGLEPLLRPETYYLSFFKEYLHIQCFYWVPGFAFLALVGLFYLWKNFRKLFYSTLLFYFPVTLAVLSVPREETKFLITVYLVSTQGLVAFWGFIGIFKIFQELQKKHGKAWRGGLVLFLIIAFFWTGYVFKKENKSHYDLASDFSINALKLLPSRSIFLAEGDNYVVPLFYEKWVLGLRKDIVFIPSIFLFHNWGWHQLAQEDPSVELALHSSNTFKGRLKALIRLGRYRGLFYTLDRAYLGSNLKSMGGYWMPWALEEKWVEQKPSTAFVARVGLKLISKERWRGIEDSYDPMDVTTFEIHHYYANQFFSTGSSLRERGDLDDALDYFDRGLSFYPRAAYAYSDMAAILGSEGYLELSRRLCLLGIQADPRYFANYSNLSYVYFLRGEDLEAKDCFWEASQNACDPLLVENGLRALAQRLKNPRRGIEKDLSASQYEALGKRWDQDQMFFLGSLADQIGAEWKPAQEN